MQPILSKDNANRVQNQQACLIVLPRCSLSYAKIYDIFYIYGIYAQIINVNYINHVLWTGIDR